MRGAERSYSQGRRPTQVFPYKEESAGYSGVSKGSVSVPAWTRLQGVGPRKFSQPPELVCGILLGHASTCPTFHPGLFAIGQGASVLSGYFLLNGGGEG